MSSTTTGSESCNSRSLFWLTKSCFPNHSPKTTITSQKRQTTTLSSLPDDLLLECLTRVPTSSLSATSLVSRKWSHLVLHSQTFYNLRRYNGLLRHNVIAFSVTYIHAATLGADLPEPSWIIQTVHPNLEISYHSRLVSVGRCVYIIAQNSTVKYDTWTRRFTSRSPMLFSRKKFAAATIHGKIYVSGGSGTTGTVEEYDPSSDTWRIVSEGSRRRYGCIGASVGGVFYVIGGLKIGRAGPGTHEAYVYASSMDAYDVMSRVWLRTRAVPGGGCVVAACTANGYVYVLASHTVELSFWRYEGKGKEWCRIRSPPLPAQVRIDGSVRFSCVGVDNKRVLLVQMLRGFKRGLVLVYDSEVGEWSRVADLPDVIKRPACVSVEC